MRRQIFLALASVICAAVMTPVAVAQTSETPAPLETAAIRTRCGPLVVAEFAWGAAELAAAILERLIRDGYGCDVVRLAATPDRALALIGEGVPFPAAEGEGAEQEQTALLIAPGVLKNQAAEAKGAAIGAEIFSGEEQAGWYAPVWLIATHPEIRTLTDAAWAPELFAAEPGARPRVHLCPARWPCHADNIVLAERLRLSERFEVVTPKSGDALTASLIEAYARREPWLGFYWSPSATLAEYPMRRLGNGELQICDAASASQEENAAETVAAPPNCRAPFAGPRAVTAYASAIDDKVPSVAGLLARFEIPEAMAQVALAWKLTNNASTEQTATHLFQTYPDLWRSWLGPEARDRFGRALVAEVNDSGN